MWSLPVKAALIFRPQWEKLLSELPDLQKYNAKVIAFAGSVTKEATACNKEGIDAFFPILRSVCTLAEAMDPVAARNNMTATVEQVFRLL